MAVTLLRVVLWDVASRERIGQPIEGSRLRIQPR